MKYKPGYYLLISTLLYILSSCSIGKYVPATINMPLAGNKHQLECVGNYGTEGLGFQSSYAIDSHIVAIGSASINRFIEKTVNPWGSTNLRLNNYQTEFGLGFYTPFDSSYRFEIIAGGGYGTVFTFGNSYSTSLTDTTIFIDRLNGAFSHSFIQADIGQVNKNVSMGFGFRVIALFTNANNTDFEKHTGTSPNSPMYSGTSQDISGPAYLIQPNIMFAAGVNHVKIKFTVGYTIFFSGVNTNENSGSIYANFIGSTGIAINFFGN